jgi:serine protease
MLKRWVLVFLCILLVKEGFSPLPPALAQAQGPTETPAADSLSGFAPGEDPQPDPQAGEAGYELPTRLVVTTQAGLSQTKMPRRITTALQSAGIAADGLQLLRSAGNEQIYSFDRTLSPGEMETAQQRISSLDGVATVEEDRLAFADATPNDPYWYCTNSATCSPVAQMYELMDHKDNVYEGIDAEHAWDLTTGSSSIRVAVLDTGSQDHPDMAGRWMNGYDFISVPELSGDGNGWDSDPHDVGYQASYQGSSPARWHGLHVAGTIGAIANNNYGVVGVNWQSPVMPVRVLGWGGGYFSDIASAIQWSAGIHVDGVPDNPNPVRVINMSLGGSGSCPSYLQNAIDQATDAGTIVVAAAGNNASDVSNFAPANCDHVIRVANYKYTTPVDKDSSSNYGALITISGPGRSIPSTVYTGTTSLGSPAIGYKTGTSMASPHVAGVVSLMLSVNPSLSFSEVETILKTTAKPFPASSSCVTMGNVCGAGIVNAYAAVSAVELTLGSAPQPEIVSLLPLTADVRDAIHLTLKGSKLNPLNPPNVYLVAQNGGNEISLGMGAVASDGQSVQVEIPANTAPTGSYWVEARWISGLVLRAPLTFNATNHKIFIPAVMKN